MKMESESVENKHQPSLNFQKDFVEQFFTDGKRKIDYVLVYNSLKLDVRRNIFLSSLQEIGLEFEEATSMVDPNIQFIKIHTPKYLIIRYSEEYDIPLKKQQKQYIRAPVPKFKFLQTELTSQDKSSPNFERASDTLSGNKPTIFLRNERSMITYNILKRIVFGANTTIDIGIAHLVERDVFIAAYPPHDGTSHWNNNYNDPLNDRQLLRKYWASPKNFFKTQPLGPIERYFGANIALYFAWLSFYNKMLLMGPIIIGFIVTIVNWSYYNLASVPVKEACASETILCPFCKTCSVTKLKDSCSNYKLAFVTDNDLTVFFATLISFWAVIYMVLWERKQAVFSLRWNLRDSDLEVNDIRPEFENFAKHVRLSEFGDLELYIPVYITVWRKVLSWIICIIMIAIVALAIVGIIMVDIHLYFALGSQLWASLISSFITVGAIMVFRRIYEPIVIWLVYMEIPRTQTEFDNSYIIKLFCFSFVNNYGALIYIAFLKGKFYTHPNDEKIYNVNWSLISDQCNSSGCISEVYILLQILVIFLPILNHVYNYIYTKFLVWFHRRSEKLLHIPHALLPRWEKDYSLADFSALDLLRQYEEMVVQFGFVTLFAFAFPAAPIVTFISNIVKIHIDAYNLVVESRRPQSKRTATIGAWLDIMKFITYLSIFTNAIYITFTSDFFLKYSFKNNHNKELIGYVNFTLSSYVMNLDHWPYANIPNGSICYYIGFRNPPDHHLPYEFSYEHYSLLTMKFAFIILFEHVILLVTALISYAIPSTPSVVRDKYAVETMELRKYLATQPSFTTESLTRFATRNK